ncbi:GmrSD restriction endonuclease domain-containing protein [Gaopeijia maritima]
MSVHKITPSSPRIAALLSDVAKGNIKIPVFQREFVWTDEQIMSLLDSIYRGYPVGSLLLWATKEALKYEREVGGFKLPETPEDYPVNYVLDGQQRLTTLYGVFNADQETGNPDLAIRFAVAYLPKTEEFVHESVADPASSILLSKILDTTKLLPELARFGDAEKNAIAQLTERFKDYEFPVVTIRDRTNQEVCRVFQRINSSGTQLSTLELLAAWTWSDQFDLRNEISGILDRLAEKGFEDLGEDQVMRCLTAIVADEIKTEALVDLPAGDLVKAVSKLKQALNAMVDFLATEMKIKNVVFLPFPIMVVPLARFFADELKPSATQRKALRKWFWYCSFTQRYRAGTNKAVMEDLKSMKLLAAGGDPFATLSASVDPGLFTKTWRINSTAAKATICLLAQFDPKTFLTGAPIDLGTTLAAYNSREFHHIYPKAFLANDGIQFHESNVIANICMLTADDNKQISDKNPADYFDEIPPAHREDVLHRALVPMGYRDGTKLFSEFVNARASLMAEKAGELIST